MPAWENNRYAHSLLLITAPSSPSVTLPPPPPPPPPHPAALLLRVMGGEAERDPGGEKIPSPASAKLASDDVEKQVSECGVRRSCVISRADAMSNWGEGGREKERESGWVCLC